jgi:hypothetical protein
MDRHFYRCYDCLTVMAAEVFERDAECGLCGGPIEHMGRVERDRLVKHGMECACDFRCTSARGPKCDCKCGGKNHGSGLVIPVRYDMGAKPVLVAPNSAKAQAVAEEWRAGQAVLVAQIEPLLRRKQYDRWLPANEYAQLSRLQRALRSSRGYRTHATRMKTLAPYLPAPTPKALPVLGDFAPLGASLASTQRSLFGEGSAT